jgi:hypothetical protein
MSFALPHSPEKIVGHTYIKSSARCALHYIDVIAMLAAHVAPGNARSLDFARDDRCGKDSGVPLTALVTTITSGWQTLPFQCVVFAGPTADRSPELSSRAE